MVTRSEDEKEVRRKTRSSVRNLRVSLFACTARDPRWCLGAVVRRNKWSSREPARRCNDTGNRRQLQRVSERTSAQEDPQEFASMRMWGFKQGSRLAVTSRGELFRRERKANNGVACFQPYIVRGDRMSPNRRRWDGARVAILQHAITRPKDDVAPRDHSTLRLRSGSFHGNPARWVKDGRATDGAILCCLPKWRSYRESATSGVQGLDAETSSMLLDRRTKGFDPGPIGLASRLFAALEAGGPPLFTTYERLPAGFKRV